MKIYLDIFFLVNTCMNFIVLTAECMFQRQKIRLGRILLASSAGAVMAVLMVVSGIHTYKVLFFLLYLAAVFLVIYIAFGKTTWQAFAGNTTVYYVMSAVLAAVIMQLQNITGQSGKISLLLLGGAVFCGFLYWVLPCFNRRRMVCNKYYRVRLFYNGINICGTALLDTGNQLSDPFGHEPVSIGEKKFLEPLFAGDENLVLRYIPFHTIDNEGSVIAVFRLDAMIIEGDGKKQWRLERPWMALALKKLSVNKEYQVILHPDMMAG